MPLIPRGLTPGFVDRIRREVTNLNAPGSVINRTLDRVRQRFQPTPEPPAPEEYPVAVSAVPSSVADVEARIRWAGARWRILRATYHDSARDLEPYSFRYRAAENQTVPLLYAYCHKDDATEAFRLDRFQALTITDRTYGPPGRWQNEFAP